MGALRRLLVAFGWRVVAVPVLAAIMVFALLHTGPGHRVDASDRTAHGRSSTTSGLKSRSAIEERPTPPRLGSASTAARSRSPKPEVAVCARNKDPQLVLVSLSKQRAWMCERTRQLRTTAVTTGKLSDGSGTPTGTWQVYGKETDRYLNGADYSDFVHYWVPFFGDFGFHDATWQKMPFGSPQYRTRGSHGCVHLPTATMRWLYDWVQLGATATVVR